MSRRLRDLTGQRFGRLVVRSRAPDMSQRSAWRCDCDCGTVRDIRTTSLVAGNTLSCGCLQRTAAQERLRLRALSRAAQKRYRPVDEVFAEVFRNPLDRLAAYAKAAKRGQHDEVTA